MSIFSCASHGLSWQCIFWFTLERVVEYETIGTKFWQNWNTYHSKSHGIIQNTFLCLLHIYNICMCFNVNETREWYYMMIFFFFGFWNIFFSQFISFLNCFVLCLLCKNRFSSYLLFECCFTNIVIFHILGNLHYIFLYVTIIL